MSLARTLGNLPGNICTPTYLGEVAKKLGREFKSIKVNVLEPKQIEKLGMGSFLSVARGSAQPARFIVMHYQGKPGARASSKAASKAADKGPIVLIGKGITALFARPDVTAEDRDWVSHVLASTGELLWLDAEPQLDAVTALSGSGPAYMFYFMEAMTEAGAAMGLPSAQAYQLAVATFIGAGELARQSTDGPEVLRQRVTSKGGTTYAAITSMEQDDIKAQFAKAMQAAHQRAQELGDEFGGA